jgi:hypothetical protein
MLKEITKTSDCPFRDNVMGKFFCNHPSKKKRYCTWLNEIPYDCPMTEEMVRFFKLKKINLMLNEKRHRTS